MKFTLDSKTLLLVEIILFTLIIVCYFYKREDFVDLKPDYGKDFVNELKKKYNVLKKQSTKNDGVANEFIKTNIEKELEPALLRATNKMIGKLIQ